MIYNSYDNRYHSARKSAFPPILPALNPLSLAMLPCMLPFCVSIMLSQLSTHNQAQLAAEAHKAKPILSIQQATQHATATAITHNDETT